MIKEFYDYLIKIGLAEGTARAYTSAISRISQHYSEETNQEINIYNIQEQNTISEISYKYSQGGEYANAGGNGHGVWRNAAAQYFRFFASRKNNINETSLEKPNKEEQIKLDLQQTLYEQIAELFPNYRIFGENDQGIGYAIGNRKIDVLLEHLENNNLLVVELKSGEADYIAFGQIAMYIGLVQEIFPSREVSGMIISGSIHESLRHACTTTDRIELKVYKTALRLEEA